MKATKKIVGAACALVAAVALSAGSTFAWFATNTTVTANNLQVSANTDNAYLIISKGTTLTGNSISADSTMDVDLYPVKPMTGVTLSSANIGNKSSWGTGNSTNPNDANTSSTLTVLPESATLSNYVAKESFMVGIVADSGTVANNLVLKTVTISDENDGITVVVVCGTNLYSHAENVTSGSEVLANASQVTTTGVQVDVYVYIDGSNANVKTSNAVNLGATITLQFSIG